jgi:hypothetical protein
MIVVNYAEALLTDLADVNPIPRGLDWFSRENFDPMHGLLEITYAGHRGWIDIDRKADGDVRFKLTGKGIQASRSWVDGVVAGPYSIMLKARDLVRDLVAEGVEEKWILRSDFDPPHRMDEIRSTARRELIDMEEREDGSVAMRLNTAGRGHLCGINPQPEVTSDMNAGGREAFGLIPDGPGT